MTKMTYLTLLGTMMLVIQACSNFGGSRADYAIPGCEKAWIAIDQAHALGDLKTLVVNNCSRLYEQGWRLAIRQDKGEQNPAVCDPAWNRLASHNQLDNVKFMITHNCPVFYRHRWVIPPS